MEKKIGIKRSGYSETMNLLLFLCFFFYMAFQIYGTKAEMAGRLSTLLSMVFVPGFIFRAGYCYGSRRADTADARKRSLLIDAGRYYVYFFFLTFVNELLPAWSEVLTAERKYIPISVFTDVLSFLRVPAVSALFLTLALMLLAVRMLDEQICRLAENKKKMILAGALCILSALLQVKGEMYDLVAVFFGATGQQAVPGVPFFAFFLLGIWYQEKEPDFDWKTAAAAAAVSICSLLLYRTPLQALFRVTVSFLPVYLLHTASKLLARVTVRSGSAAMICRMIEPVFLLYSLALFGIYKYGGSAFSGFGTVQVLAVAAAVIAAVFLLFPAFILVSRCCAVLSDFARNKVRRRTAFYFSVYTAAFSLVLFLVFFEYVRTGKTFIVLGDGVSQYFPRAIYFSRYIRNLVKGLLSGNFELMMYDFRLGLGAEVNYSMEPLYFLFALFGEDHMEFAYDFITVLRFYLAGVSMSILCLYFRKGYFAAFLASVVYVVSGFPLYGATMHTNFMIPLIMLPLLILSMEEILQKRRWYLCTIFVAVSLYSNYYYLYMNTIAMGVYFLVRFFCQKEGRTFRNFLSRGLTIVGSYLLGVAMASVVLVTNFGVYLGSGRSGNVLIKTPSLFYYDAKWLVDCFMTFITTGNSPGNWMKFGFLPLTLFVIVILFMRKGRKELKLLMLISFGFAAFPLFGFIFSGFSAVVNRWCYIAALVVAFATADCLPDLYRLKKNEKIVCAAVMLLYGVLAFFGNNKSTGFTQVAFLLLAAAFVVLLIIQVDRPEFSPKGSRFAGFLPVRGQGGGDCADRPDETRAASFADAARRGLIICLVAAMVFWQGFSLFHIDRYAASFMNRGGSALKPVTSTPLQAVEEVGDDSFYRVAMPKLSYYNSNASMLFDYNDIYLISSTYNGNIMKYLEEMGSVSYSPTQMLGLNNSAYMNNLAAVKYYAAYEEPGRTLPYGAEELLQTDLPYGKATVYENKYALPIGYTYRDSITEEELESYDSLERQEVLMQKVLLHDTEDAENVKNAEDADVRLTVKELKIKSVKESRACLTEHALIAGMEEEASRIRSQEKGKKVVITPKAGDETYDLKLNFKGTPNSETYLVLEDAFLEGDMSEEQITIFLETKNNKVEYDFSPDDYRYKTGQKNFVFNLGYHKKAITSCKIRLDKQGMIQFKTLKLYSLPMDNMELYTENLTEHVLEDVEVGTNRVAGRISLDEDRFLVLSIPYQRGWTALVDGEKAELHRANYMYMALELDAGEHTVELTYEIPGIRYAFAVTGAAFVLFIVLLCAGRRRRKRRQLFCASPDAAAGHGLQEGEAQEL